MRIPEIHFATFVKFGFVVGFIPMKSIYLETFVRGFLMRYVKYILPKNYNTRRFVVRLRSQKFTLKRLFVVLWGLIPQESIDIETFVGGFVEGFPDVYPQNSTLKKMLVVLWWGSTLKVDTGWRKSISRKLNSQQPHVFHGAILDHRRVAAMAYLYTTCLATHRGLALSAILLTRRIMSSSW